MYFAGLKGLGTTFRSLRHRNYRLYFGGQGISLIGTWMQQLAVSWLIFRLTHSAFLLGIVGFATRIPTFFFVPFAGVFVDRWDRHRILVITQLMAMLQALIFAFLVLTGTVEVWHIIALSLFLGFINAMDNPARQAFIVDMVENEEDLGNAIGLNSSLWNGSRLLGPSIAGILIAVVGEGVCFLINGLSFIAVVASLLAMKIRPKTRNKQTSSVWQDIKEGYLYAFRFPPIRAVLVFIALANLMGMPYVVLVPVFAKDILHGGAQTLGFLMAASGCGALGGAVYLASRKSVLGLWRAISISGIVFGASLVLFALSQVFLLSMAAMVLVGFGMIVQNAGCNTVLQTIVEDDKRGRTMGFFTMAAVGMQPFGSLLAGGFAHAMGAPKTVVIGGAACMLGAVIFAANLPALKKMIRPIYVEKGIVMRRPADDSA